MPSFLENDGKKFFIPEVIQTSEMDCGPASLKALLDGFGIYASYGRLREACQTSVDGTSIDSIEDLAVSLGLDAEQIMVPLDHLLLDDLASLPALVVTRNPSGVTHFVVAWNLTRGWVQLMDPGIGRRWVRGERFLKDVFNHTYAVNAAAWGEWAKTEGFTDPLRYRMRLLKISDDVIEAILSEAMAHPIWLGMAALDASIRMVDSLVKAKAIEPGAHCGELIQALYRFNAIPSSVARPPSDGFPIPLAYWSVTPKETAPGTPPTSPDEEEVMLHGAVLIKVNGLRGEGDREDLSEDAAAGDEREPIKEALDPELEKILTEKRANIEKTIWETIKADGTLIPIVISVAFLISALGMTLQAYLIQGLFRFQHIFNGTEERIYALAVFFGFLLLLFLLDIPLSGATQRVGRRLETRLRIAFLKKIPLLSDRYFHSRLTSDMNSRAHGLKMLRNLPGMAIRFLLSVFKMLLTFVGVVWLQPDSAVFAILSILIFSLFGWVSHNILEESDMRMRTHSGALSRFYLDAFQGLLPLRTHGAERAFRREHEGLLTEWMRSNTDTVKVGLGVQGLSALLYALFSAWVGFDYITGGGQIGSGLLLFYWTLSLPSHGQNIVSFIQEYPATRNSLARILEPLDAQQEMDVTSEEYTYPQITPAEGVRIELREMDIVAGGHAILKGIDVSLEPGDHLAIVGPSGAGKSSLVGVLLGWHTPANGECLVDGKPLNGQTLIDLRRQTAWVDPAVQLWNKTLLDNLTYGNQISENNSQGLHIVEADLFGILQRMDNGLQTVLGEGGGLVSGGEGQRVRLARAMNREHARLVILDEPFRGLDRDQRRKLLTRAREYWKDATLICITHDLSETVDFERVLVIENGHIIEDGNPRILIGTGNSRYNDLLRAEQEVRERMWASSDWRHLRMEGGKVVEG